MTTNDTCISIGPPNPDISGLGVLIAIFLQAFISIVLSLLSGWHDLITGYVRFQGATFSILRYFYDYNKYGAAVAKSKIDQRLEELSKWEYRGLRGGSGKEANERFRRRQKILDEMLLSGSDAQSILGIALLFATMLTLKDLSLYHFHMIYDTVSVISITHAAAMSRTWGRSGSIRLPFLSLRSFLVGLFLALYLTFSILFGIRLNTWDPNKPGHCYNTSLLSRPSTSHPKVDHIYLAITCIYLFTAFYGAILYTFLIKPEVIQEVDVGRRKGEAMMNSTAAYFVLLFCMCQFPLHLYSVIALRVSNAGLFEGGDEEREWGFGQILAVALMAENVLECIKGGIEYYCMQSWSPVDSGSQLPLD